MTRPSNGQLVIASRGSRLALTQTELVASLVRATHPGLEISVRTVKTTGDKDTRPFAEIGGKGLFTSEVEREVVEGSADVAVHSAKDLTAELHPGCVIVCVPERASVHDVVVGGDGATGEERIRNLSTGARIGTSSIRRRALLAEMRPHLEVVDFRGNLDTRLRKVAAGEVDAAILAAAGIERLGHDEGIASLDPERWVPPPGQGALAIEARADDDEVADLFVGLGDNDAAAELALERSFGTRLEGGCTVPLGCLARTTDQGLVATAFLGTPDAAYVLRDRISGPPSQAEQLGAELAEAILGAGGDDILAELMSEEGPRPSAP